MNFSSIELTPQKKRTAFYLRVSSEEQKNSRNIERQIDTAMEFYNSSAFTEACTLVKPLVPTPGQPDIFFVDNGYNAEELQNGTALLEVLELAKENRIDMLYVDSVDRLLRSEKDEVRGKITDILFFRKNVKVYLRDISMAAEDGIMLTFLGKMAAKNKANFLRLGHLGKKTKTKNENRPASGHAIYGYALEKDPYNKFVIVEEEAKIVRWVVKMNCGQVTDDMPESLKDLVVKHPKGPPDQDILEQLHALGYNQKNHIKRNKFNLRKGKEHDGKFAKQWISHLFTRGYYAGERISRFMPTEKIRMSVDDHEYEVITSKVPQIVTVEDWALANSNREHRYLRKGRHEKQQYLLNEVLFCAHCGLKMGGRAKHKLHRNGHGKTVTTFYTCNSKTLSWRNCEGRRKCHNAKNLEPLIVKELKNYLTSANSVRSLRPNDNADFVHKIERLEFDEKRIDDQLLKYKEEEVKIFRLEMSGSYASDIIQSELKRVKESEKHLTKQKQKIKNEKLKIQKAQMQESKINLDEIQHYFDINLEELPFKELKQLFGTIVKTIRITSEGKVDVFFKSVQ